MTKTLEVRAPPYFFVSQLEAHALIYLSVWSFLQFEND